MADGGVDKDIVMLVLGHDLWRQVLPCLSPKATVTGFSAAWSVPYILQEPVHSFTWPVPTEGSCVTVEEPDASGFFQRVEAAGVELPDPKGPPSTVELLEQFEDEPDSTDPGSFVLRKVCLNCHEENLWIEGGIVAMDFIEAYTQEHELDDRASRRLLVMRCASCLEVHIDCTPTGLVTYTLCQA